MSSYQFASYSSPRPSRRVPLSTSIAASRQSPEPGTPAGSLRGFLESQGSPSFAADDRGAELWKAVQAFYAKRGYEPAWFAGRAADARARRPCSGPSPPRAGKGCSPSGTTPRSLTGAHAAGRPGRGVPSRTTSARLDVALTYAFLRYAADLAAGSVDPRGAASLWRVSTRDFDAAPAARRGGAPTTRPVRVLADRAPGPSAVRGARRTRWCATSASPPPGGWPVLPARRRSRRARAAPGARRLRARLRASGDTLQAFQQRHGLRARPACSTARPSPRSTSPSRTASARSS